MKPQEHPKHPGFYEIPFIPLPILISLDGRLYNTRRKEYHFTTISTKGYVRTTFYINGKYQGFAIHRLLALLFVPRPEKHKYVPFEELQVNHKDGNKLNNAIENLEWVTGKENMEHARESGLFDNEVTVLSKNIITGLVRKHKSISACAREIMMTPSALYRHLNSYSAGRIVHDDEVFKFDDGKYWPNDLAHQCEGMSLKSFCNVHAFNEELGRTVLFNSLKQACHELELDHVAVMNTRSRKGQFAPYQGWVFSPLSLHVRS